MAEEQISSELEELRLKAKIKEEQLILKAKLKEEQLKEKEQQRLEREEKKKSKEKSVEEKRIEKEEKTKKSPVYIIENTFDFIKCFNKQYISTKLHFSDIFKDQDIPSIFFNDRNWYILENKTTLSFISKLIYDISGKLSPKFNKDALDLQETNCKIVKFEDILNASDIKPVKINGKSTVDYVIDSVFLPKSAEERDKLHRKVKYFLRYAYQFWTDKLDMIDVSLVISSHQGIGKSYFAKWLAGMYDPIVSKLNLFTDGDLDFESDKKLGEAIAGKIVAELGELKSLMRANSEDMKRNISKQYDSYRRAYDQCSIDQKRTTVFIGTTNYFYGILKDPTGNRRWIIVKSNRKINESCVPEIQKANWFSFWKEIQSLPEITPEERKIMQDEFNEENEQYVSINTIKENLIDYINQVIEEKSHNCYDESKFQYRITSEVKNDIFMSWKDNMKQISMIVDRIRQFDPYLHDILSKLGFEIIRPKNKVVWVKNG
jgi:hypothetical protein